MTTCNRKHPRTSFGSAIKQAAASSLILFGLAPATLLNAQTRSENAQTVLPTFAVASIHPSESSGKGFHIALTDDSVSIDASLLNMMSEAFGVEADQIVGLPDRLKHKRYDIQAKVAEQDVSTMKRLTYSQKLAMLQSLFSERFALKFHHETQDLPIYLLTVAKGGIKMKEWKQPNSLPTRMPGHHGLSVYRAKIESQVTTMGDLAEALSSILGRLVIDKTDLAGDYDYTLQWTPYDSDPESGAGLSIFTALQQELGLKLEAARGPVDVIVIDHVEPPTPN